MKKALVLGMLASQAVAEPQVDKLQLYGGRMPFQRDYFYPKRTNWGYELELDWNTSWSRFIWENKIAAHTYNDRFRDVSWSYKVGFRVVKGLDVLWNHRSQHALDLPRPEFPVRDSFGVRITWGNKDKGN